MAVINRTVPSHVHLFEVTIRIDLPLHTFRLHKLPGDDIVQIEATSGVIACKGFYHYLKFYCNGHVSWDGSRINMPDQLPDVNVTETSPSRFIYYQNVCTWSYSFAFWKWNDWQRHIDWMAMQGITLTLAPVQELIWYRVYTELGLTKVEIDDHFAGPAFFAWQRMGNIRGFGGPLPKGFMLWSSALQKRMIQSFRDLGIAFALPSVIEISISSFLALTRYFIAFLFLLNKVCWPCAESVPADFPKCNLFKYDWFVESLPGCILLSSIHRTAGSTLQKSWHTLSNQINRGVWWRQSHLLQWSVQWK